MIFSGAGAPAASRGFGISDAIRSHEFFRGRPELRAPAAPAAPRRSVVDWASKRGHLGVGFMSVWGRFGGGFSDAEFAQPSARSTVARKRRRSRLFRRG